MLDACLSTTDIILHTFKNTLKAINFAKKASQSIDCRNFRKYATYCVLNRVTLLDNVVYDFTIFTYRRAASVVVFDLDINRSA